MESKWERRFPSCLLPAWRVSSSANMLAMVWSSSVSSWKLLPKLELELPLPFLLRFSPILTFLKSTNLKERKEEKITRIINENIIIYNKHQYEIPYPKKKLDRRKKKTIYWDCSWDLNLLEEKERRELK